MLVAQLQKEEPQHSQESTSGLQYRLDRIHKLREKNVKQAREMISFQNQDVIDQSFLKRYNMKPNQGQQSRRQAPSYSPVDISKISPLKFSMRMRREKPPAAAAASGGGDDNQGDALLNRRVTAIFGGEAGKLNNTSEAQLDNNDYHMFDGRFEINRPSVDTAYGGTTIDSQHSHPSLQNYANAGLRHPQQNNSVGQLNTRIGNINHRQVASGLQLPSRISLQPATIDQ